MGNGEHGNLGRGTAGGEHAGKAQPAQGGVWMSLVVEIRKKLGSFQLDVQFQTHGQTLALLGASGCGKSMTLRCIAGIETPAEGRIILNDRILFDSRKKSADVSSILHPDLRLRCCDIFSI